MARARRQAGQLLRRRHRSGCEKRGRAMNSTPGTNRRISGAHVSDPRNSVSSIAAGMQQPVGEDMAALGVGGQLDLVDGQEGDLAVQRHGFDGANPIARTRRQDLLLAGHQRDRARALEPRRCGRNSRAPAAAAESRSCRAMAEHALDREMGLAGIGRAQDRRTRPPPEERYAPVSGRLGVIVDGRSELRCDVQRAQKHFPRVVGKASVPGGEPTEHEAIRSRAHFR